MSVQTQIDRISGAVQSALAALEEKGVTVPSGTKVDGLAALIAAIEAGGGGGGGGGGGSVDTCTIVFDSRYNDTLNVQPAVVTRYVDGSVVPQMFFGWGAEKLTDVTVTDVVCGSPIVFANIGNIAGNGYTVIEASSFNNKGNSIISGGIELIKADSSNKYIVFRAPTVPGATGKIGFVVS